jgi:hypothetical protein
MFNHFSHAELLMNGITALGSMTSNAKNIATIVKAVCIFFVLPCFFPSFSVCLSLSDGWMFHQGGAKAIVAGLSANIDDAELVLLGTRVLANLVTLSTSFLLSFLSSSSSCVFFSFHSFVDLVCLVVQASDMTSECTTIMSAEGAVQCVIDVANKYSLQNKEILTAAIESVVLLFPPSASFCDLICFPPFCFLVDVCTIFLELFSVQQC